MSNELAWNNLKNVVDDLVVVAASGDRRLERFLRRKLELWAINRGSGRVTSLKSRLRKQLFTAQKGLCAECNEPLDARFYELDRIDPAFADDEDQGYRPGNVRAVHPPCNPRGPRPAGR